MHHDHEREGKGVRAAAFKAGQGDAAQVDGLVKAVVQRFGRLDILVNTAGVFVTGSDYGKGTKDEEASRQSGHRDRRVERNRRGDHEGFVGGRSRGGGELCLQ
jgi:NAD(P)-dependent dehydrogenase (short-subunit alcohol dehydrogenase family)